MPGKIRQRAVTPANPDPGRRRPDFHDFNEVFREDPGVEVVAFTAAQIPGMGGRRYPAALAGGLYPAGIPIREEGELEALIEGERIDEVVFAYSDVSHEHVMHLASRVLAKGAGFRLCGPAATMLAACDCDAVLVATPVDLRRLIAIQRPVARLTYAFAPTEPDAFERVLRAVVEKAEARSDGVAGGP